MRAERSRLGRVVWFLAHPKSPANKLFGFQIPSYGFTCIVLGISGVKRKLEKEKKEREAAQKKKNEEEQDQEECPEEQEEEEEDEEYVDGEDLWEGWDDTWWNE